MDLIGIQIDGVRHRKFSLKQNPTWFFKVFMNYCIDNHHPQLTMDDRLHEYFSTTPLDPIFGAAIGTAALC